MIVNNKEKWVYLFEPHTASRATRLALEKLPGCKHVNPHHCKAPRQYWDYTKFVTVRNPFDTVVTKYFHGGDYKHMSFQIFVRRNVNQPKCAPAFGYYQQADYFLRFEDIENQLRLVFGSEIKLELNPHHQSSIRGKQPWHTYYNDHLYEVLEGQKEFDEYLGRFTYGRFKGRSS